MTLVEHGDGPERRPFRPRSQRQRLLVKSRGEEAKGDVLGKWKFTNKFIVVGVKAVSSILIKKIPMTECAKLSKTKFHCFKTLHVTTARRQSAFVGNFERTFVVAEKCLTLISTARNWSAVFGCANSWDLRAIVWLGVYFSTRGRDEK